MVELTMPDLAGAMRAAVRGLVDRLDTEQRRQLVFPFDGDMHKRWTYLPGQRPGLRLGDLSDEQLEPAMDLLQLVHSVRGWSDTQLVIQIEAVRRELSLNQAGRDGVDPYRDLPYWLVVLGDPTSTDPWAWRINGHHLLAQATVVGDQVNGVPHFFGAEPAAVLEGPHAGLRALPREEDLARELMLALQEDQRRMARIAVRAPADIASRWDPVAALPGQPRGIRYARLDRLQRELFVSLLREYVDRAASAVANQAWTDITDAGLDEVCFGWAGPVQRGTGHYYALIGPSLLIEYDNTQDGPTTSTPCGATYAATSPGTCWHGTTRACATDRSARGRCRYHCWLRWHPARGSAYGTAMDQSTGRTAALRLTVIRVDKRQVSGSWEWSPSVRWTLECPIEDATGRGASFAGVDASKAHARTTAPRSCPDSGAAVRAQPTADPDRPTAWGETDFTGFLANPGPCPPALSMSPPRVSAEGARTARPGCPGLGPHAFDCARATSGRSRGRSRP